MTLRLNVFSAIAHSLFPWNTGPTTSFNPEVMAAQAKPSCGYSVMFLHRRYFFQVDGMNRKIWVDGPVCHGFCGVCFVDAIVNTVSALMLVILGTRFQFNQIFPHGTFC